MALIRNHVTEEGRQLGREMARMCDVELVGRPDNRCATCAFRRGDHLANGSVGTLMTALKCVFEGEPFWCHEIDRPCAGWQALRSRDGEKIVVPWDYVKGDDQGDDVISLPDETGGRYA